MKSKMYKIFGIIVLIQILVAMFSEARRPRPYGWTEKKIRDNTKEKSANEFAFSVTLYHLRDYFNSDESIAEARSCYIKEENNYKDAVWNFTEQINSIFGAIKDKYQNENSDIVAIIQTVVYHLLNIVRDNPYELDLNLKPGKEDEFHKYIMNLKYEVFYCDYEFDIWMQRLLQERYYDKKLPQCDDLIKRIHTEIKERCEEIMKNIKNCLEINLEKE